MAESFFAFFDTVWHFFNFSNCEWAQESVRRER